MRALLLLLIALIAIAAAKPAFSPVDLENFVLGVFEGLEEEFAANATLCLGDEAAAGAAFEAAITDIETGVRSRSVRLIERSLKEFGLAFRELALALKDCNVSYIVADIEKIAQDLSKGAGGIIEIVVKETIGLWFHRTELSQIFTALGGAWRTGNYFNAGEQVGKLLGILLQDAKKK